MNENCREEGRENLNMFDRNRQLQADIVSDRQYV